MEQNKIVIDAMGGDHAPLEIIKGTASAIKESESIYAIFVGRQEEIQPIIEEEGIDSDRYEIVAAADTITMDEKPKEALDSKPDASINVATRLIRDGGGDALVSAGSTGATILACSREIPRMPGIERGVLAAIFPAMKQQRSDPGVTIMLDVGATLHCSVSQLITFAIMGMHYGKEVLDMQNPRIGLLNIGEEETKGHSVLVETHQELKKDKHFNFVGNVEGKDIMRGVADVIVTEGYTGNVVLKSLEGIAEMGMETGKQIWKKNVMSKVGIAMLSPVLKKLKKRLDYSEQGGAPILGFRKLVIKAHGRSKAKAIKNAVLLADRSAGNNVVPKIEASMKEYYMDMFENGSEKES